MTAHTRIRVAAAVGALLAPLVLVAASSAPASAGTPKHKHEMVLYKVESTVKLGGAGSEIDSPNQSLSCNPGDYVLDGMWLVKHVDQYAPDPDDDPDFPSGGQYNDERDVWVQASYPDQGDFRTWRFKFENKAYGDAQLRLAVTCINGSTQHANGHNHNVNVSHLFGGSAATTEWGAPGSGRFYVDSGDPGFARCTSGSQYFVAPGFDLGSTNYRMVGTHPSTLNAGLSWEWQFAGPLPRPANINVYGRCIDRKVVSNVGHRHSIAMKHVPSVDVAFGMESFIPKTSYPQEVQYQCDQSPFTSLHNYKAMVGWFWMGTNWQHNWYIGMEPRPKLRAFTFWNPSPGDAQVKYGTLCINARTSNPTS